MFRILVFPEVDNPILRDCLGILGFVFRERKKDKELSGVYRGRKGNYGRNVYNYSFVPSKFIQALNRKTRTNLIEYLIKEKYIKKAALYKTKNEKGEERFERESGERHKLEPNIYYLENKLLLLGFDNLNNPAVERVLENNLHLLHSQSYNHWARNYRKISINVPSNEVWEEVLESSYHRKELSRTRRIVHLSNLQTSAQLYGREDFKHYDISSLGFEHKFGGMPTNIFTKSNPILRQYTSLKDAVEIGIKHNEGVIIADQILKKFGINDFSKFFIDQEVIYRQKLKEYEKGKRKRKPKAPGKQLFDSTDYYSVIDRYFIDREVEYSEKTKKEHKIKRPIITYKAKPLFDPQINAESGEMNESGIMSHLENMVAQSQDLSEFEPDERAQEVLEQISNPELLYYKNKPYYRTEIQRALFWFEHSYFFDFHFRQPWRDIVHQIKAGNDYHFEKFVDGIQPWITKNDWRIQIKDSEKDEFLHNQGQYIFERRGEIYYKVMSLVYVLRLIEIMRAIWKKLHYFGILCIPIYDKVLVGGRYEEAVKKITLDTWRRYLDPRIKIFPEVIERH
jgi:hypothetical protein